MSIADILDRAADLIEPEGAWIRYYFARTPDGRNVTPRDPDATSYCALGAITRASENCSACPAIDFLESRLEGRNVAEWNNAPGRTQPEVVSAFREAAAKAREQGL